MQENRQSASHSVTPRLPELKLVAKKLPISFCEFKISNTSKKMLHSDTQGISCQGVQIPSSTPFPVGTLMRLRIEIPDYWRRKSRHVNYKHTSAPQHFQMLARVSFVQEAAKRGQKHVLICESVNIEDSDAKVLQDFLDGCPP